MRLLLFVICLLFASFAHSQSDVDMIPFVAYWEIGDKYDFRVTKVKTSWKDGERDNLDSTTYIMKMEVIDSTETSYKVKLNFENKFSAFYEQYREEVIKELGELRKLEVIYSTSEMGEFIGIDNWEELIESSAKILDVIANIMSKELKDDEAKDSFMKITSPLFKMYSTKEALETVVFKELKYFHFPLSFEYDANETLEYEDALPSIFGGKPVKANAKIYFESVDHENLSCVFRHQMEIDKEGTNKLMQKLIANLGLKDKEMKKQLKKAKFQISDNNRFEYFYYPGIPIEIETIRTVNFELGSESGLAIERIKIELLGI